MLTTRPDRRKQSGFAIVSAIFILVALAVLGAFIAAVSSMQHVGSALDVQGAQAYQAARSGTEWGVAQALGGNCAGAANIGPFNGFTITVNCNSPAAGDASETGLGALFAITATACNQPIAGACPGTVATSGYVERRISVVAEQPGP